MLTSLLARPAGLSRALSSVQVVLPRLQASGSAKGSLRQFGACRGVPGHNVTRGPGRATSRCLRSPTATTFVAFRIFFCGGSCLPCGAIVDRSPLAGDCAVFMPSSHYCSHYHGQECPSRMKPRKCADDTCGTSFSDTSRRLQLCCGQLLLLLQIS